MSPFRPGPPLLSRRRAQPPAQIQIAPLIDVLLVLLVLGGLMWAQDRPSPAEVAPVPASPAWLSGMPVTLPTQSTPLPSSAEPAGHEALIGLGVHGQLSWQGRPVTLEQLLDQLQAALARDPGAPVWLAIDATTPYAEVIHWLDRLQARHVTRLNLLTTRPAPASPAPEGSR